MINPGDRFGRLTVIELAETTKDTQGRNKKKYLCKCICGNTKAIAERNLKDGNTKSCGCIRREGRWKQKDKINMPPIAPALSKKQQISEKLERDSLSWLHRSMK